jgi:hypothetical protein
MHVNTLGDNMAMYEKCIVVFSGNSNSSHSENNSGDTSYQTLTSFSVSEIIFTDFLSQ